MPIKLPDNLTHDDFFQRIHEEYKNALDFRRPATESWAANEQLLYGKKPKTLSKRSNIMIQFAAGFEDTLLAKIKNPPVLDFGPTEPADIRKARKITSLWEIESSVTQADWEYKDILTKKLAVTSGRAVFKIYSTSKPYKHYLEPIDTYDFLIDPMAGGMDTERARHMGQDNIFKSRADLRKNKTYDQKAVEDIINETSDNNIGNNIIDNEYREKQNRFAVLGFNIDRYNLQKDGIFKLLEWYTTVEGVRWYALVSLDKKRIIKAMPLEDLISADEEEEDSVPMWPFESWAYYPDLFNFWSPSPLDKVRELFIVRNIAINQAIDNNESKNKPMKSYDANTYNKPQLLEYRPDGLVPTKPGTDPSKGLYIHQTPDIYSPKEMNDILEDISGKITGISAAAQGSEDSGQKVGIYYGNMQETAGRMSLFELSYTRCYIKLGKKYVTGLKDHLDEPKAIKMIGADGVEWDEIKAEELGTYDIRFTGGVTQAKNDAVKSKMKNDYITQVMANPATAGLVNAKIAVEQGAKAAGFTDEEAKLLMTPAVEDDAMVEQAHEDIQMLLNGKQPKFPLHADTDYLQTVFDFRYDNELSDEQDAAFDQYIEMMIPKVAENMAMKAQKELAVKGQLPTPDMVAGGAPVSMPGSPSPIAPSPVGGSQPGSGFAPPPVELTPNTPGAITAQASEPVNMAK